MFHCSFTGLVIVGVVQAIPKSYDAKHDKHHVCQEFTQGLVFNDSQAVGEWHLLHFKTEKTNGSGESHCVEFSPVTEEVRQNILIVYIKITRVAFK